MRFFLLLLLLPFSALAQNGSGFLQLYIYPDQCKILINDSLTLKSKDKITLPAGTYNLSITAPKLKSVSEKITIVKDSTVLYRKIMKYNDEYSKYLQDLKNSNFKKSVILISGSSVFLFSSFMVYYSHNQKKMSQELAKEYIDLYMNTYNANTLEEIRNKYESEKNNFYRNNRNIYTYAGVALASTIVTYYFVKKIKKPKYINNLGFNLNLNNFNQYNYTFSYKF